MRTYITIEQAISVLPDGDAVHTFYNPGFGLVGADWSKEDITDNLRRSDIIELTGQRRVDWGMECASATKIRSGRATSLLLKQMKNG